MAALPFSCNFCWDLPGAKTFIKVNLPLPQKGSQFGISWWILCYLMENQLPEVGNRSLVSLWCCCSQEFAVCWSPLTLRRKLHHCRHTAPRSQSTVSRLYSPLFAIHHETPSPPGISLCVLMGASVNISFTHLHLRFTFLHVGHRNAGMHDMLHMSLRDIFFMCDPAMSWTCHWGHSVLKHDLPLKKTS